MLFSQLQLDILLLFIFFDFKISDIGSKFSFVLKKKKEKYIEVENIIIFEDGGRIEELDRRILCLLILVYIDILGGQDIDYKVVKIYIIIWEICKIKFLNR